LLSRDRTRNRTRDRTRDGLVEKSIEMILKLDSVQKKNSMYKYEH